MERFNNCSRIYGGDYGIIGSGKKTDFEGYALTYPGTKTYNQTDPSIDFNSGGGNNVANILWSENPNWQTIPINNRMTYYSDQSWPYDDQLENLGNLTISLDGVSTGNNNSRGNNSPFNGLEYSSGSFCNPNWLSFKKSPTSSIELVNTDDLRLYPNPVNEILTIELPESSTSSSYTFIVKNNLGQQVLTKKVVDNTAVLDVSTLNKGIYFLKIRNQQGNLSYTKKFIKL